jgi:hypothetical protein
MVTKDRLQKEIELLTKAHYPLIKPPSPFKGMEEMYTSPRKKDADIVKKILKEHGFKYRSIEERRESGLRYCIYTQVKQSKQIVDLLNEELNERGM